MELNNNILRISGEDFILQVSETAKTYVQYTFSFTDDIIDQKDFFNIKELIIDIDNPGENDRFFITNNTNNVFYNLIKVTMPTFLFYDNLFSFAYNIEEVNLVFQGNDITHKNKIIKYQQDNHNMEEGIINSKFAPWFIGNVKTVNFKNETTITDKSKIEVYLSNDFFYGGEAIEEIHFSDNIISLACLNLLYNNNLKRLYFENPNTYIKNIIVNNLKNLTIFASLDSYVSYQSQKMGIKIIEQIINNETLQADFNKAEGELTIYNSSENLLFDDSSFLSGYTFYINTLTIKDTCEFIKLTLDYPNLNIITFENTDNFNLSKFYLKGKLNNLIYIDFLYNNETDTYFDIHNNNLFYYEDTEKTNLIAYPNGNILNKIESKTNSIQINVNGDPVLVENKNFTTLHLPINIGEIKNESVSENLFLSTLEFYFKSVSKPNEPEKNKEFIFPNIIKKFQNLNRVNVYINPESSEEFYGTWSITTFGPLDNPEDLIYNMYFYVLNNNDTILLEGPEEIVISDIDKSLLNISNDVGYEFSYQLTTENDKKQKFFIKYKIIATITDYCYIDLYLIEEKK